MNVKITLEDYTDSEIEIHNGNDEGHVIITLREVETCKEFSTEVSIEELKHALRKISLK